MHIGSTVTAPPSHLSSLRCTSRIRRPSPLNPSITRAAARPIAKPPHPCTATTITTSTHLANLDRVLLVPSPAPTPPAPPLPDSNERDDPGSRWGFLHALNPAGILPAARRMEDMSPRSMNMLQRLLSDTSRPSPRNGIGRRWRDLHGEKDWSGLLDPLDEDLRREIVRYGEFVQAAYHAFHSNPDKRPSDPRHVALPERSYRVTCDLFATSSIELPQWVDGMAPWMRQRSSWIGFVAVCDSEREIQRLGRRDVVVTLRGTATALEWVENFRAAPVSTASSDGKGKTPEPAQAAEPKVECGFWSLFRTRSKQVPSLRDTVVEEVQRLMEVYKGEQLSITVTGHSLGAALAVLVADELRAGCIDPKMAPVAVFSFGGPRVGNRAFAGRVRARGVKVLRVVNERDVITKVPGVFAECHSREVRQRWRRAVAEGKRMRLLDKWLDSVDQAMMAWGYSHVGSELRVDSRQSPYLKPDADPGCCHDLEAYLHLVDGFRSSRCPFRSNAKRSIAKLVTHQGPNLKRHYTSKALAALRMEAASLDAAAAGPAGCRRAVATAAGPPPLGRHDQACEVLES